MASHDLEPQFVKALRLLHSKSKDSTEQLKLMVDEALAQKNTSFKESKPIFSLVKQDFDSRIKKSVKPDLNKNPFEELKKKEIEKRPLERYKSFDAHEAKRARLDSPASSSSQSPQSIKLEDSRIDDSDTSEGNADDFAMEMGLACIVCKLIDVSPRNQLIECHECHNLYHQECHRPPAVDADINDPRKVWYCAKCHKNLKKMASKPQKAKVLPTLQLPKDVRATGLGSQKSTDSAPTPFKRTEIKVNPHSNLTSGNKPVGLVALADDIRGGRSGSLSSKTKPFTSLLATSTQPKSPNLAGGLASLASVAAAAPKAPAITKPLITPTAPIPQVIRSSSNAAPSTNASSSNSNNNNSSLLSADKRLQKMKKKAAIKQQEKRRPPGK